MAPFSPGNTVRQDKAVWYVVIIIGGAEVLVAYSNRASLEVIKGNLGKYLPASTRDSQHFIPIHTSDALPLAEVGEPVEPDDEVVQQSRADGVVISKAERMREVVVNIIGIDRS